MTSWGGSLADNGGKGGDGSVEEGGLGQRCTATGDEAPPAQRDASESPFEGGLKTVFAVLGLNFPLSPAGGVLICRLPVIGAKRL